MLSMFRYTWVMTMNYIDLEVLPDAYKQVKLVEFIGSQMISASLHIWHLSGSRYVDLLSTKRICTLYVHTFIFGQVCGS